MFLTDEQQAILNGEKGETMAKVMKTLVMYGDAFGADKLVPVTSQYNHLCKSMPVITSSNKLRTYTPARYYTEAEILEQITRGGK